MRDGDLADQVRRLAERVSRLETRPTRAREGAVADEIIDRFGPGTGTVHFGGSGRWGEDAVTWQRERDWDDVRRRADDGTARVLAALGSTVRLRIVAVLLAGPATTAALTEQLAQPSTGQLFHHLKELLAAGVVHQPVRGTYAVRHQDVIPLLALLSASLDIAASGGWMEPV